ncbi:hypothetical protein A3D03_04715 [Candidatus Gottesmanbacteria bacterium RIFCSPHIGHO2_02_FULL_40_13]|uniref:Uncharacterized protein n=1 Tax=Candidatus Gottesmanbacteria bacterium RIFCSPHIGHO2_02_FULL_40_13 TaxID=1798384 RepID=A0A1F6AC13_9BACT|nr:MAG: hypothetical protein A3D03_04715 [Candidatus Gottesmanbacteria bacterium RIFCSPHIGHO2_02_FULL_40_13]
MLKKTVQHSLILLLAIAVIFFWQENTTLSYYSLQLSGVLLLTLIVSHHLLKPKSFKLVESTISTMAVLLITSSTGGVNSPLFFLNFLLLFELSLLLEPLIPLFLSGILLVFYLLLSSSQNYLAWLELLAFPLMTPLAIFTGQIYINQAQLSQKVQNQKINQTQLSQKVQNQKKEIHNLSDKIENLEEEIVEEELNISK